jgi:hypothetical protein
VALFGECTGCHRRNVTDVDRADARVADGRNEVSLHGDHRLECEQTLEIQVGTKKREAYAELTDTPLDGRVVAKKANRRCLVRRELGEFHETPDAGCCRKFGKP